MALPLPHTFDGPLQEQFDAIATQLPIGPQNLANSVRNVSSEGPLRIIRGTVLATGARTQGAGFTSTRTAAGRYTITFAPAFSAAPSETFGGQQGFLTTRSTAVTFNASQMGVLVTDPATAAATDQQFSFIVIGPA